MHSYLKKSLWVLVLFITTQPILAQSSSQPEGEPYIVEMKAVDFAFAMPSEIPSGWVTFRMENLGQHEHHGIIEKFPDSLGYEKLSQMVYGAFDEAEPYIRNTINEMKLYNDGGPSITSPGKTSISTFYMEPGLYVFTCWLPASDGEYHAEKGMRRVFQVTEKKSGAPQPEADVGLTLSNFFIEINDPISAGEQVFDVFFEDNHNIHLARLEEEQHLDTLTHWMNEVVTPSEFTFLGGVENEPVGSRAFFKADLDPGRYAFVTYRRAELGMVREFTVPASGTVSFSEQKAQPLKLTLESNRILAPDTLMTGFYSVTASNRMSTPQRYLIFKVKEGYTGEDAAQYFEKKIIRRSITSGEGPTPYKVLGGEKTEPGAESQVMLNLQEGTYLFLGPFADGPPPSWEWSSDKIHSIKGIDP